MNKTRESVEAHREQPKGKYMPTAVWLMYDHTDEKANRLSPRILTAEEMMLLAKINALAKRDEGCTASNRWLGKWWGKSPHWVSESVSKFRKLKLIKVKYTTPKKCKTLRQIWTTFEEDASPTTIAMKPQGGDHHSDETTYHPVVKTTATTSYDTTYHTQRERRHCGKASPSTENGFFPSSERYSDDVKDITHCLETKIRKAHKLNGKVFNRIKWYKHIHLLLQDVEDDVDRVKTVLKSFYKLPHDEFTPVVESSESFRSKFTKIEWWVARRQKEEEVKRRENGEDIEVVNGQMRPILKKDKNGWVTI